MTHFRFPVVLLLLSLGLSATGRAQADKRWEAGAQFTTLTIDTLGEKAAGLGAHGSYDLFHRNAFVIAPEAEFNYFPQNPSGNFGETQFLMGTRAGLKSDWLGVFLKVRPGLVHLGGRDFASRNGGTSTNFAMDVGGTVEFYGSRNIGVRMDWGDTMIHFPRPVFRGVLGDPVPGGLKHNVQGSIAVVFRF